MKRIKRLIGLIALPILVAGCFHSSEVKGLSVEERHLLDARHDHMRCELKLDRLRHLYQVTEEEEHGLMDSELTATNDPGNPASDKPLVGGHDAPLTGGHDKPLTGGNDAPLTGGHDYLDALRNETNVAAELCWDSVANLYNRYNDCVGEFLVCKATFATPEDCLSRYEVCLIDHRPDPLSDWET